ncbi:MAG: antitoxin Xre/MbcA/ParS toxin-binding domain-containing protein [Bryobacteraceae bacterium]
MARRNPATKPAEQAAVIAVAAATRNVAEDLLRVVRECTDYPGELLDLDAAIEADLGIGSIKRAEFLGAFLGTLPDAESRALISAAADTLMRAHTLREIANAAQAALGGTPAGGADHPRSRNEVEMVRKATEVLGANQVARWMRSEIPSLGNQTPYALMQTEDGRRRVERVLLKIGHGVY